jgi:hypothetical protein
MILVSSQESEEDHALRSATSQNLHRSRAFSNVSANRHDRVFGPLRGTTIRSIVCPIAFLIGFLTTWPGTGSRPPPAPAGLGLEAVSAEWYSGTLKGMRLSSNRVHLLPVFELSRLFSARHTNADIRNGGLCRASFTSARRNYGSWSVAVHINSCCS